MTKKMMTRCLVGIAITAGSVLGDLCLFTGLGNDADWANPINWINRTTSANQAVPGEADEVRIPAGSKVKITSEVTVASFKNGVDGNGKESADVMIDGGTLRALETKEYNSAAYNRLASLTVQNGGSATFNARFMVGHSNTIGASVMIHQGVVRVADTYHHNEKYTETQQCYTRTTINFGGVLDVDSLMLNSGAVNIAGGTLVIRENAVDNVAQWVADGRMIAMDGKEGWKINAIFDAATGWTTVTAESEGESFSLGMSDPVGNSRDSII